MTYVVREGDEGHKLDVVATATNDNGVTISATSAATGAVLDAAPTITTPVISGTAREGQTLTASATAGQGDNPVTYAWYSSADGYTNPIGSGSTYAVQEGDESFTIEVKATVTNDNGITISATSTPTAAVLDAAPTITTPMITGTAQEGQTLTAAATAGQSDNPVTYAWYSSADNYSNPIGTGSTYLVKEGDEGFTIEVKATATNDNSATISATSAATAAVIDAAPTVTTPTISGTVQEGQTLTAAATAGQSDNPVTYAWYSSKDGYTAAIGSGATYLVKEGDEGNTIEVKATTTNEQGLRASQTSTATAAVIDASPTVTTPTITGTAHEGQTLTAGASAGQSDNPVTYAWYSSKDSYASQIGTGATYTVQEGDETHTIEVKATATNEQGLSASATSQATAAVTDIPLVVTSTVANPATGDLSATQSVTITLTMAEAATVTGSPFLTLNDGGHANYTSGSGTATLVFSYAVPAGQNTANLMVTGSNLNGGTINDDEGNAFSLTNAQVTFTGLQVDAPDVLSISSAPASGGDLDAGKTVTFTVTTSEALNATGSTLTLNDGESAALTNGSGTSTLTYTYTVRPGDNIADLKVTGGSGTVTAVNGSAHNAADMSGVNNFDTGLQIDTTAPVIAINAVNGNNIVNKSEAAAGFTISGTATDNDVNGQTVTIALQDAFDISADFSLAANPNGVWTYGYETSLGAALHDYDQTATQYGLQFWRSAEISNGDVPDAVNNPSNSPITVGSYTIPGHTADFHPGPLDQYSVYRFTAPSTGAFQLSVTFGAADFGGTDVHVLVNGNSVYAHEIDDNNSPEHFNDVLSLNAGDTVDFAVGYGTDGTYNNDSTSINASLTPLLTTTVSGGAWSVNVSPAIAKALVDGSYTVTADVSDAAGNPATEATQAIVVDERPTIMINPVAHGANSISGTFMDVTNVSAITVKDNGTTINLDGTLTINNTNDTWTLSGLSGNNKPGKNDTIAATATDIAGNSFSAISITVSPSGIAGSPINLALDDLSGVGASTTITVSGIPADWGLNRGTQNADGSWTVQTTDPSALTVTTPATFAGAIVLSVRESWTNPDGSTGNASVSDNVEAYPASPIFAVSGDDTLTGGQEGNNEFVFAQPIGNDRVYNFNAASDTIDLIGFGLSGYGDLAIANDGNGNAVVTLGSGETITLKGIDATALSASNFVFDTEPVSTNSGTMMIRDGAILPLGGTITNSGTIAINSTGDESDLEILVRGATLQGGGQVVLSDSSQNVVFGGDPSAVLDNVDNTISGAGQFGNGTLTLQNEGVIEATGANALVIDTRANAIVNTGTLAASGAGGLVVNSALTGGGNAKISGSSSLEFSAASDAKVSFDTGATGTLKLDQAGAFTGTVAGFTGYNAIDLANLVDGDQATIGYAATTDNSGGTLTLGDAAQTHSVSLALLGQYAAASDFAVASDGHGGTLVTLADPSQNHALTLANSSH